MASTRLEIGELDQDLIPGEEIPMPSDTLQSEITDSFWPHLPGQVAQAGNHRQAAYFSYFRSELDAWRLSGSPIAIQTYRDLLALVKHLQWKRNERRDSQMVLDFFQQSTCHEAGASHRAVLSNQHSTASINNALDLSIRLWLMLNVGSDSTALFPGKSRPVWEDFETLDDFVQRCFPTQASESGPRIEKKSPTVPIGMNLHNLKCIGGFDIVWTDHMADHLYLNDDLGTICLYHHATVLETAISSTAAE